MPSPGILFSPDRVALSRAAIAAERADSGQRAGIRNPAPRSVVVTVMVPIIFCHYVEVGMGRVSKSE